MAHDQEVVGLNPSTIYQMDVSNDASINIKEKLKNGEPNGAQKYFQNQYKSKKIYTAIREKLHI